MSLFEDELRKAQQFRAQMNAREQAEQAALDYENKARAAQAAQSQQSQGGLGGVLAGIGNSIGNVGKGLAGIFGGGFANIGDIATSIATGKATNKNKEDFDKWLAGSDNLKDARLKNAGTALDAAATLSDLIPVVGQMGKVATAGKAAGKATLADKAVKLAQTPIFNMAQGGASEYAQEFIDNGENANLEDALKRAAVGTVASGTGTFVGNKLANRALTNPATSRLGKMLQSNVGRSAITGATAGAVGGGMASALEGGDIGQVLSSAAQGGYNGALGGATTAGVMGLAGTGIDKLSQKVAGAPTAQNIPEAPVRQRVIETETTPTRKGIAITDYDAGEQRVNVRRPNAPTNEYSLGKNVGSTLDGVLGPDNPRKLPNAKRPTDAELFSKQTGGKFDNAADFLREYPQELENIKNTYPEVYEAVRKGARDYSDLNALQFDGTGAEKKSSLPDLNRQQYYEDTIGKLHATDAFGGKTSTSYADVPDYMRNHLLNDTTGQLNGRTLQNDDILREFFRGQYGDRVDNMDLGELYDAYERLAQAANQNEIYTPENIANGIRMNDINDDVTGAFVNDLGLRQNIDVNQYPSLRKPLEVDIETPDNAETVYTKRTIAPKTPAQPEQNLPAVRGQVAPAVQEDVPLIQRGTPEYKAIQEQEYIANRQRELRDIVTDGVRSQYGTIRLNDRINGLDDAIMELAGYGLTKRSQIDGFANRITGSNGEMSKAIRKAMNESGKTSGRIDITMDDVYRASGASGNKAAMDKINNKFNSIGKKYTVDADGNMNRSDMYDFGRELEKEGYRMIERGGRTQNGDTEVYGEAMRMLGEQYIEKATDGVDMRNYINANKLKNVLPGNDAWAKHVDESIPNIKTVSDARSFMAAPTKLSLLADAAEYNKGTYGSNVGNLAKDGAQAVRAITSGNPARAVVQYAGAKAVNSNVVKDRVVKNALKKYNNIEAGGTGKTGAINTVKNVAGAIGDKIGNAASALNNTTITDRFPIVNDLATRQIARQAGKAAVNDTNIANEKANAQNALTEAQNAYNMAVGNYQNVVAQGQQLEQQMSQGAQQLQRISSAMDAALAAGDIASYGKLADLYQQAYKIYGADLEKKTAEPKALSANQSKALAAQQQLEQLATMRPDAGTAMADIPVLSSLIGLTGGNEYANQANALATTLGYLLSGANIKESEAARIGQSYVPNAYDSEAVRQQKLARARQLIQSYMSSTDDLTQA